MKINFPNFIDFISIVLLVYLPFLTSSNVQLPPYQSHLCILYLIFIQLNITTHSSCLLLPTVGSIFIFSQNLFVGFIMIVLIGYITSSNKNTYYKTIRKTRANSQTIITMNTRHFPNYKYLFTTLIFLSILLHTQLNERASVKVIKNLTRAGILNFISKN